MKIIVDYNSATGYVTFEDGTSCLHMISQSYTEVDGGSTALELVKQGLTADDLVKLKNMGII